MGVIGLWRLVDATGKPVPLETLEGKVLAIDVSIWIHQVIQGYQDRRGNSLPNAHLIGLFNRICKLMYFKIKPVFVFDGGVPLLKKNTIATRRKLKSIAASKAQKLKNDLINNLIKHTAVKGALDKGNDEGESSTIQHFKDPKAIPGTSKIPDMYFLPDMPSTSQFTDSDDYIRSDEDDQLNLSPRKQTKWMGNIHTVNINTEEFKNLPADVRYDILTDLKETRKQSSWGRIHELPTGSNKYSGFQVERLLKRRNVQESLETAEKEMGGKTLTLEELEQLLTDQGINMTQKQDAAFRIAADSSTRVIYMKEKPLSYNTEKSNGFTCSDENSDDSNKNSKEQENNALMDSRSICSDTSIPEVDNIYAYDLDEDWLSDDGFNETTLNESSTLPKNVIPKSVMNPALAYMLENSGLSKEQILKIVEQSKKNKKKSDTTSSQASSKRKIKSRRSSYSKGKRKKLFDTIETPKIMKEVPEEVSNIIESSSESDVFNEVSNEPKVSNVTKSDSESDDFVEVSEIITDSKSDLKINDPDKLLAAESSDSESNDFIEVQNISIPELVNTTNVKKPFFEVTVKAEEKLVDDIFADIFTDEETIKKLNDLTENKPVVREIKRSYDISIIESTNKEDFVDVKNENLLFLEERKSNHLVSLSPTIELLEVKKMFHQTTSVKVDQDKSEFDNISTENKSKKSITIQTENEGQSINSEIIESVKENKNDENIDADNILNNSETFLKYDTKEISDEKEQYNKDQEVIHVNKEPPLVLPNNEKELESMKEQLETEQKQINESLGKLERQAIDITDQMRLEAQELLRLFGIPYIVAPMEAEAQCAYLEQIKLTDGTVTDDSDIWLFGGNCVYKNFFDNNKKVLQFLSKDIEHHFKLSRKELILLALLVGSDYTNGLAGVGPVTALEIIASFPCEGEDILRGLRSFCAWFRSGKLTAPSKLTLRNKLKNVQIEKGFPSQAVVQAYLAPTIDESKEEFTWGKPNLVLLADYVKKKFGWTKLKFDEIINPVMQRFTESKSQKGIDAYFKVQTIPKSIESSLSKRVQSAVQRLGGKSQNADSSDDESVAPIQKEKPKRIKKIMATRGKKSKSDTEKPSISTLPPIAEMKENDDENQSVENDEFIEISESQQAITTTRKKKFIDRDAREAPKKITTHINETIPQREKDKVNALKSKLKAIEVFRKSKLSRVKKTKKVTKKIKDEAELSESNSDS
ncbi:DNA excision repair protein ERCC-5 homolog [Phymastichus coffea]|uniref:DNA excision repair protein ERCC-5 homolog n=1 Tax=Phymastichus coffea TaxID=108790 RepID=UPI00273B82B6|nr:DNA excision repair protein ERCC-5 homolog [Phymastichus coffea]